MVGVSVLAAGLALSAVAVAERAALDDLRPLTDHEIGSVAAGVGRATVTVEADTCAGPMAGSGFLTAGRVVTSGHLVAGAAVMTLDGAVARQRIAVGGALHPSDLAFSVPLAGPPASAGGDLELAGPPSDGAPVVVVSRADGRLRWLAAVARTIDGEAYGAAGPLLLLDRAVAPGWSGGPVVDRSGRVVGVVRAVEEAAGITLAEPVDQLRVLEPSWWGDDIEPGAPISCKGDHPNG